MKEATILVSSLLRHTLNDKLDGDFKRLATSTIISIVYDHPTILSDNDCAAAVEGIEKLNVRLEKAMAVGSYFVNIFFG